MDTRWEPEIGDEVVVKIGGREYQETILGFTENCQIIITSQAWGSRKVSRGQIKSLKQVIDDLLNS